MNHFSLAKARLKVEREHFEQRMDEATAHRDEAEKEIQEAQKQLQEAQKRFESARGAFFMFRTAIVANDKAFEVLEQVETNQRTGGQK
jgi:predicted  nucleic acid-binding Zn-ribbon protein